MRNCYICLLDAHHSTHGAKFNLQSLQFLSPTQTTLPLFSYPSRNKTLHSFTNAPFMPKNAITITHCSPIVPLKLLDYQQRLINTSDNVLHS